MRGDLSYNCNTGDHSKCAGEPPSAAMSKFLPAEMHDVRCACPCHDQPRGGDR